MQTEHLGRDMYKLASEKCINLNEFSLHTVVGLSKMLRIEKQEYLHEPLKHLNGEEFKR